MIELSDIKKKAAKSNAEQFRRLFFFSSRFSVYFSWLFINLGLSANQVTGIFFVTGLAGSLIFLSFEPLFILMAYTLWRLHIIFDLCDGDVARYNKQFSINGAYWDYMIHSVLFPLCFVCISISLYLKFNEVTFLILSSVGGVVVSQLLAVKNNYYRAMLFDGKVLDSSLSQSRTVSGWVSVKEVALYVLSFDGFLLVYVGLSLMNAGMLIFLSLLIFYILIFLAIVAAKFFLFSRKGFYGRRS